MTYVERGRMFFVRGYCEGINWDGFDKVHENG